MENYNYWAEDSSVAIEHHGILGQKWGRRRYQYEDGSLTPAGRERYLKGDGSLTFAGKRELKRRNAILDYERGRQVREAEAAAKRDDYDTITKLRAVGVAASLDDTDFKQFEAQYEKAKKEYENTLTAFGVVAGGIIGKNSDYILNIAANKKLTDIVGKNLDPDDAIQDYIGRVGLGQSKDNKTTAVKGNKVPEARSQNTSKISGISSEDSSRYGLMTEGLSGKDSNRYVTLWEKIHSNPKTKGMDIMDLALNVDSDDPNYMNVAKDVDELIELHNKAYHNVYG